VQKASNIFAAQLVHVWVHNWFGKYTLNYFSGYLRKYNIHTKQCLKVIQIFYLNNKKIFIFFFNSDHLSSAYRQFSSSICFIFTPYKLMLLLVYRINILLDLPTYLLISFLIISFYDFGPPF